MTGREHRLGPITRGVRSLRLLAATWVGAAMLALPLSAQIGPDEAVRKILDTIDEELREIDRLLMQSSDRSGIGDKARAEQVDKLIDETQSSQERVVRGIDQLIDELQKMQQSQQQGGGGEGRPQDQQRSQGELEDQEQTTRIDEPNQRPQGAPRPQGQGQPRPGEQQQQQGESEQPNSPGESQQPGENRPGTAPADAGEERVIRDADRARWGNLPNYDLHQHLRGGLPQVPEKYRKLLDEYHRNNQRVNQPVPERPREERR